MWSLITSLLPGAKWLGEQISLWTEHRRVIVQAETEARIAHIKAQAELAAYKAKADIEWDLKWADAADRSWKDEFLLVLWSVPIIGLFIPGMRPFVMEGFDYLRQFNPNAAEWYMAGWSIIFAAVFGLRQAVQLMAPTRMRKLAEVLVGSKDDVPKEAVSKAQRVASEHMVRAMQADGGGDDPQPPPHVGPRAEGNS